MKPLEEALEPDTRWRLFMVDDPATGLRPITFADHYADVRRLDLPGVASPLVERLYERAQHCLLYAWLDYELSLLAEAQAFSSLDLALKLRIADAKIVNLSSRLKHAVKHGWISPPPGKPFGAPENWPTTHELLLNLRNDIMHGSAQVHDFSMAAVVFDHVRAMICELSGIEPPTGPTTTFIQAPTFNGLPLTELSADALHNEQS